MKIRSVSIEKICQASLRLIREQAIWKGLKISSTFPTSIEVIQADECRLKQILVNLLSNAVKFTLEGGTIGLAVVNDVNRQMVHFTVWDTGVGLAPQDRERLFQPWMQFDNGFARSYVGPGRGLSLVYRLTKLHDGQVSVESEVGRGSRFTVSLPWAGPQFVAETARLAEQDGAEFSPTEATEIASTTEPAEPALRVEAVLQPKPGRVLLVEDSEENITTFSDYLAFKNYEVVVARNGHEAIELARQMQPDLILMDIQMPEMDGLEATRRLRADPELASTPVIALTALAMPGDQEQCFKAGVNDYLTKPVSLRKLAKIVEAYLSP